MARPNAFFRCTGSAWTLRTREEIEAELERERRAKELEDAKHRFVEAARARLRGGTQPLPDGCAKFARIGVSA